MKLFFAILGLLAFVQGQPREGPPCPDVPPTVCQPGELMCIKGQDNFGCTLPNFCVAPYGGMSNDGSMCVNQCPCRADEIMCANGQYDDKGCLLPPECVPRMLGQCRNFCPTKEPCPAGSVRCPSMKDDKGCPSGNGMCSPPPLQDNNGKDCPPSCPLDCPSNMKPCNTENTPNGCPVYKCIDMKEPCLPPKI